MNRIQVTAPTIAESVEAETEPAESDSSSEEESEADEKDEAHAPDIWSNHAHIVMAFVALKPGLDRVGIKHRHQLRRPTLHRPAQHRSNILRIPSGQNVKADGKKDQDTTADSTLLWEVDGTALY